MGVIAHGPASPTLDIERDPTGRVTGTLRGVEFDLGLHGRGELLTFAPMCVTHATLHLARRARAGFETVYGECHTWTVLADGAPIDLGTPRYSAAPQAGRSEAVTGRVTFDDLERMANASRLTMRVCHDEVVISATQKNALRRFVSMMRAQLPEPTTLAANGHCADDCQVH